MNLCRLNALALTWAVLPVVLWLLCWFRAPWGIVTALLVVVSYALIVRKLLAQKDSPSLRITTGTFVLLILVALWMVMVGIGGFVTQEQWDNAYRNAVLQELTLYPWPVTHVVAGEESYLSYYLAFWLPAAGVGKIFGSYAVAQVSLFVYSYLGLAYALLAFMHHCPRRPVMAGVLLFVFAGCDWIATLIFSTGLEWYQGTLVGADIAKAPSLLYLCRFIYNQGVPAVVILPLMWYMKGRPGVQLFLFMTLFVVAPFVSLPVAGVLACQFIRMPRRFLTLPNISGVAACLLTAIFFLGNSNSGGVRWVFGVDYTTVQVMALIGAFLVVSYVVYLPFIWSSVRRDALFWGLFLFTLPFLFIMPGTDCYDYGWKVPTAFTLYFMAAVIRAATEADYRRLRGRLLAVVMLLGVLGNSGIYHSILMQHYHRLVLHRTATTGRASTFNDGRLFANTPQNLCRSSFVATGENFYTRWLMPY